jgi:simple sugar transport system substrate-binding protein
VAEEKGIHAFGWDSDMAKYGPHAQLTANTENWGGFYVEEVRRELAGTWTGGRRIVGGLKEGLVVLTPLNSSVPPKLVELFTKQRQGLISGQLRLFSGPLKDNTGVLRVPTGGALDEAALKSLDWYVEGVLGAVPK